MSQSMSAGKSARILLQAFGVEQQMLRQIFMEFGFRMTWQVDPDRALRGVMCWAAVYTGLICGFL
jgi:hypothetical protein